MKTVRSLLVFAGLVGAVIMCDARTAAAQEKMSLKLVFPTTPTTFQLPHFVAKDQGWLDKAGLKVEEIWVVGDSNSVRALLAGQADVAAPGVFAAYSALTEGAKIKAIASWQPRVDYMLLARDKIKTVADLAGARMATAGPKGLTLEIPRMLMKKHGVDPGKTSYVHIGGHDARLQAIVANKVDAGIVSILFAAQAKQFKEIHVLASIPQEFPALAYTYLIVNEKDLSNPAKRKALETYVKLAVVEASRFIMQNPDKAAEIMRGRTPDLKLELIKDVVLAMNANNVWGVNGGLDAEATEYTVKLAHDMEAIKRPIPAAEILDSSIVGKVLGETGTR